MEENKNIPAFIESDSDADRVILSIIIPVYNEEKNIEKCMMSIINQLNYNYEVLIIDNNSTDNTLCVCEKMAEINKNIFVYSELKRGVSAARNKGMEMARGDYVMFVDGDDFLSVKALSVLIDKTENAEGKIIQGNIIPEKRYCEWSQTKETVHEAVLASEYMQRITLYAAKYANKEKDWVLNSVYGVFGKLFPKKVIKDLRFHEDVALGEDMLFYLEALRRINEVVVVSDCVYVVNDHNIESSTRRINLGLADSVETATDKLIGLYGGQSKEIEENLYYQVFRHIEVGVLEQIERICLQRTVKEVTDYAKKYLKPRADVYKRAYRVILKRRFCQGAKRYILYYLPIFFLKRGWYRLYCYYVRSKEKMKRYKNEYKIQIA